MIKHLVSALAGAVIGSAVTLAVVFGGGVGLPQPVDDVNWFNREGVCITTSDLKVLHVLGVGRALVGEKNDELLEAPIMLLVNDEQPHFYDEQIIEMPAKKCAKHVGNFNFQTKDDDTKTVPVIKIN